MKATVEQKEAEISQLLARRAAAVDLEYVKREVNLTIMEAAKEAAGGAPWYCNVQMLGQ